MYSGHASFADAPTVRVRRRGPSAALHATVVVVVWLLAAVVTLAVAADTKIGPVVLKITPNHGFHAGDVYTMLVMALFASVVTLVVLVRYWFARRR